MLNQLPTELRLRTLSYLGVRDLHNVQLASRSWRSLFVANEASIYRYAASHHALIPYSNISLEEAKDKSPPCSMYGVISWKGLGTSYPCNLILWQSWMSTFHLHPVVQRRFEMEYRWQGHWNPGIREIIGAGSAVHRIKVDQEAGYIITTSSQGGLIVTDLVTCDVLWSLSQVSSDLLHEIDQGSPMTNTSRNMS